MPQSLEADRQKILYYDKSYGALGFEDVMLYPADSDIDSRYGNQIDTSSVLARGLAPVKFPVLSAGMDTVTEDEMAITTALVGGFSEIHRNNSPIEQAAIISKVKDRLRVIEERPPILPENAHIGDAFKLLEERKRGYIIIHEGPVFDGNFSGLVTKRDLITGGMDEPVSNVMIKRDKVKTVQSGTTLKQAVQFMLKERLEKVPMVDAEGKLVGMYSMKDDSLYNKNPFASLDQRGRLMVGAAIGISEQDIERAHRLVSAGADAIFIDIAHGQMNKGILFLNRLKTTENIPVPVIYGNAATARGVSKAVEAGADAVKIGVGPGSICWTRIIAGAGVPQVTAILEAREEMSKQQNPVPIIADGGVRIPHDFQVAIVAGADGVMMGGELAATSDSPGEEITEGGIRKKILRGMASKKVFRDRQDLGNTTTKAIIYEEAAEGGEELIPVKGETRKILYKYFGGLLSGMSYTGAHNIAEMQTAQLIHVTTAGANEHTRR